MLKPSPNAVPQVISIVLADRNGKTDLKKVVKQRLGSGADLRLIVEKEILLTTRQSGEPAEVGARSLALPSAVRQKLELEEGTRVALIERPAGVAIKKLEIVEREAEKARVVDYGTAYRVVRTVETNPMPDQILPRLASQ